MNMDKKPTIGAGGSTVLNLSNSMGLEMQKYRDSVTFGDLQPVWGAPAWN